MSSFSQPGTIATIEENIVYGWSWKKNYKNDSTEPAFVFLETSFMWSSLMNNKSRNK